MKNEKLAKTLALKKIVKAIIENEPEFDNGMSYEEYCMKCDLNGVKCSFEDDNFMMFLFGKLGQDYEANIDFRNAMIDALSTFGRKAVPELISFLGDPNGEIREKAMDEIKSAISDGEDLEIAQDVAVIMKSAAITDDSEMEDIAMNLNMINDNELILKTVVDIMENGASDLGKKWADDMYLFTTGEHYTSKADAERWIAENCDE